MRPLATAVAVLATVGLALGISGYRWTLEHVRYYTGDDPKMLSCASCHVDARGGSLLDRLWEAEYRSPTHIAVSPSGDRLYVTARDSDALLDVDVARRRVVAEIKVGRRPHAVVADRAGKRAYVTNEWSDSVSVVDLDIRRTVSTLATGDAPLGLALGPDEEKLFVANWFGNDVSVLDLRNGEEVKRLAAGSNPCRMAVSPDGAILLVTNQLSHGTSYPSPPVSEVTLIDTHRVRVTERKQLMNAHLLEGMAFTPGGEVALVTLVRPKNLLPAIQVAGGWMMTSGVAVIDFATGRVAQVLLDEVDGFYADPYDVVIPPNGRLRAFMTHSGVDTVTVVDLDSLLGVVANASPEELTTYPNHLGLSRRYVVKRIPVGANPKGLAASPDGRWVYVAERLADRIAIIDAEKMEMVDAIDLGGPRRETVLRRGEKLFNSADATFQGQFSCRSCHPRNHVDRLQYDLEPDGLGENILDNRTLLGIAETSPFKWNGKNTSLHMQCGIRFARFLTRSTPFPPEDLSALVGFIGSLRQPPNRYRPAGSELTPAQERGKAIFERTTAGDGTSIPEANRCITCHPPPLFTDRRQADVGTGAESDTVKEFDTPQLGNIYESAPYLHDGRASSLEEIWTRFSPDDTHGVTSDLGKQGLNDLIEYLKALGEG